MKLTISRIFPLLFLAWPLGAALADDTAGVPQALGGTSPATICAPQPPPVFNPYQACATQCSCTCPNGIITPAVPPAPPAQLPPPPGTPGGPAAAAATGAQPPAGETAAAGPAGPPAEAAPGTAGPNGANAAGAGPQSYHSSGMFGYHRPAPLPEIPLNYPNAEVDRPLILPAITVPPTPPEETPQTSLMTQPEAQVSFFNSSVNAASSVQERVLVGAQTGLSDRWQAGVAAAALVTPGVSLDTIFATGLYGVSPSLATRLGLGMRHAVCPDGSSTFIGGVGAAAKYKLNPHLAVFSGRTELEAFQEDDLLTWDTRTCGATLTVGVPLGVTLSMWDVFNMDLRTGYRHLFGSGADTDFIPFSVDLYVVVAGQADLGVTFELPNALGTPAQFDTTQSSWFEQRFTVFAQTRL